MSLSIFSDIMSRYAQESGATTPEGQQDLDPNTLQVGQQIYDQDGKAHTVIQNENGNITTMPVDQAGQQIPQGVKNIDQSNLGNYSQQPPQQNVQAKVAQEESGIDWEELESISLEVATFAKMGKEKQFFEALDRLNTVALSYIQMPTDVSPMEVSGKKAQQSKVPITQIENAVLSAFEESLDDILYEAGTSQDPGFFEVTAQELINSIQNNLIVNISPNLLDISNEKFGELLNSLEAYVSAGETPEDPHTQKLLEYYQSYFS